MIVPFGALTNIFIIHYMKSKSNPKSSKKIVSGLSLDEDEDYSIEYEWMKDLDSNFKKDIQNKIAFI